MQTLRNLSIGKKLAVLCGTLIVAMSSVGFVGYQGIAGLRAANEQSGVHLGTIRNVLQARIALDTMRSLVLWQLLSTTHSQQESLDETLMRLEEVSVGATTYLSELRNLSSQPEVAETIAMLLPVISEYVGKGVELVKLATSAQPEAVAAKSTEFQDSFLQLSQAMELLSDMVETEATATKEGGAQIGRHASRTALWVLVGTVFLASLLWFMISRLITTPLSQVTVAAQKIAQGDINQRVDYAATDETGALAAAFRNLVVYLRTIADAADCMSNGDLTVEISARSQQDVLSQSFLRMTRNMREATSEIQASAQILVTSVGQIMSSAKALAYSVTETATSVSQTAVTIGEAKQTAHLSGRKATEIAENAGEAARVSQTGEHAVDDAMKGMSMVRGQMESIAQSVLALSEQTQAIHEIIAAVNALSEQSNLLAVNAAIEAAKAGEAGKGFGVVAQEVKRLAEQSKQSTAQVRAMLDDIRKAGTAAILVTEQGVKSADIATRQSEQAGESIRLLTRSISESAQAVTQIAASNQQQIVGMEQVSEAIESIKHASAHNARGMQQIESATHDLHTVSQTLRTVIARYKLQTSENAL
ncbi:MAG: methyl-accepting chemotaxis protein [Deltaproteobacteria bacterium]|nr:methyl-accepting chemotaxis protein [Deltaproteobacteria bacterium]